jgi:uncharacterized protein (DUF433 family)
VEALAEEVEVVGVGHRGVWHEIACETHETVYIGCSGYRRYTYSSMDWQAYIHRDPAILGGKPVFRGTRLGVGFILEHLAEGWTDAELLEQFPTLKSDHIRAAQAYAAQVMDQTRVVIGDSGP